jgi:hypothetical protein
MKIIRILWGDFERYSSQIINAKKYDLNEKVFVWGKNNYQKLTSLGYDCHLINEQPYDYEIADNHTFISYGSLTLNILGLKTALELYSEVLFLDWDCIPIKPLDDNFYQQIKSKNTSLQVPMYCYPKYAFDVLKSHANDEVMNKFFDVLNENVSKYSHILEDSFVLPNTGFFYCNDVEIIDELLDIIKIYNLQGIPDELSVLLYTKPFGLDWYIENIEPAVISGKKHNLDFWNDEEKKLSNFIEQKITKDNYFEHL